MPKTRLLISVSGTVLIVAVIVAAVIRSFSASAVEVKTGVAEKRVYEDKVLATGKVETVHPAEVVAPYAARLVSLRVKEGDRVVAGQSLGEMDITEIEKGLREAEAAYNIARAELDQAYDDAKPQRLVEAESALQASRAAAEAARKKLERYRYLLDQGVVSTAEYEDVETAYIRAKADEQAAATRLQALKDGNADRIKLQQARLNQAQVALDNARSMADKGHLPAPIDGIVLQIGAKEGAYLQPGAPILTIGDPDALEVVAEVSEQDIGGIAPGQDVDLNWAGAPDKTFKGRVSRVSPAVVKSGVRESENVVKVYIEIIRGRQELKPGATVDAVIYRVKPHQAVLIPNEAVIGAGRASAVFVVENGRAHRRVVTVGYRNELYTEIRSGIEPGKRVILNPKGVKDGQPVRETGGEKK